MLPISWPVSVVLALFMTAIHIIYRIGASPGYAPDLSMVSPSFICIPRGAPTIARHTLAIGLVFI